MNCAVYARVSTADKGQTIEQQLQPMLDYCQTQGWQAQTFVDYASGSKESRPQLDLMLQQVRAKAFNIVLVLRLDRLGRSLRHLLQVTEELRNKKIRFISLTQGFDTETSMGRFAMQILGAAAELERELIRERVIEKNAVLKSAGVHLGRPFGSKDKGQRRKSGYWQRWANKGLPNNAGSSLQVLNTPGNSAGK